MTQTMKNKATDTAAVISGQPLAEETRHVVIYGYTHDELSNIMRHFEAQLPDFIRITISSSHLVTRVTLTGVSDGNWENG